MTKPTTLPEALANDRQSLGMTQEQMAQALEVPFQSLTKWERGLVAPRDPRLRQLIAYFGETSATGQVALAIIKQRQAARKLGTGMNSALAKYIQKPTRDAAEGDPVVEPIHPAHDPAFMQESERIFGNEAGMRQGFENKRARLKRQLLLGTADRPMDMEQARMAALEALEKFDQASDELGMAVAWTSVLRDHLLAQRGDKTTQNDDLL